MPVNIKWIDGNTVLTRLNYSRPVKAVWTDGQAVLAGNDTAVYDEALAFAAGFASLFDGGLNIAPSLSLNTSFVVSQSNYVSISDAISMAISVGLTDATSLEGVAQLTLAFNSALSQGAAGSTYTVETTLGALMAASLARAGTFSGDTGPFSKIVDAKNRPVKIVIN